MRPNFSQVHSALAVCLKPASIPLSSLSHVGGVSRIGIILFKLHDGLVAVYVWMYRCVSACANLQDENRKVNVLVAQLP